MSRFDIKQFRPSWLVRKKHFEADAVEQTQLRRCLGLIELTAVGVGSTLGAGVYVVTPSKVRDTAGPAMCISFVIAAIASVLSGLCYAELGARVPRAGSAYVYAYAAVGEIWAFVVGWNMILEYVIGTASVARAAVVYLDVFANGTLEATFGAAIPMNIPFLGAYFDPVAFGITILLTLGGIYANPENWSISAEQAHAAGNGTNKYGDGGFMPYGFGGVMKAASAAFYSFVGFDCIAATGEEVKNPQRNLPLAIILSLTICTLAYVGTTLVFSLDEPYYLINPQVLLPSVSYGYLIVASGALVAASASLLAGMIPLPRVVYAMASDGLLFSVLGKVSEKYRTPLLATFLSGVLTAIFAAIFDVDQLVNMLSIGTLMAYSLVAASVLVLRFRTEFIDTKPVGLTSTLDETGISSSTTLNDPEVLRSFSDELPILPEQPSNFPRSFGEYVITTLKVIVYPGRLTKFVGNHPNPTSEMVALLLLSLTVINLIMMVIFALIQTTIVPFPAVWWPMVLIIAFALMSALLTIRLWQMPQNLRFKTFKVPLSPFIPILALAVNFYLLVSLDKDTWIRFAVWMAIGAFIYVFYSIWFSKERAPLETTAASDSKNGSIADGLYSGIGGGEVSGSLQKVPSYTGTLSSDSGSSGSKVPSRQTSAGDPPDENTPVFMVTSPRT